MNRNQLLLLGPENAEIEKLKKNFGDNNLDVEINATDDFDNACMILRERSPMVVISTDILVILKILMKEKDFIKDKSTKTILYNTRGPLPDEVEGKLNASGLTDELTSDSSEKALYYKTTLYLKSLPAHDDGDDILYDGQSNYDPNQIEKKLKVKGDNAEGRDKVCYIKDVQKTDDGKVAFETSSGHIDSIVLGEFCDESNNLIQKMETIIEQIEDEEVEFEELKKFSDHVAGIMGTSSVLGLEGINIFCQLTKSISDHIMHYDQQDLRDIVVGVLGDSSSFLATLMEDIRGGDESSLKNIGKEGFISRLHWLSEKFKISGEEKVKYEEAEVMPQASIDDLLDSLNAA